MRLFGLINIYRRLGGNYYLYFHARYCYTLRKEASKISVTI
jgi:hypothetical protein